MKQIVNVVINYANEEEILIYAKNVSKQTVAEYITLVVVINKQGNTKIEDFQRQLNEVALDILIYNPNENLGYMNGLIYGYSEYSSKKNDSLKWVVMSNTDIEFTSDKFFEMVLEKEYGEDIWCIGPSVYSPTKKSFDNPKSIQRYSLTGLNRRIFIFERPLLAYAYIKLAVLKAKFTKISKNDSQPVYSVHGCFFIVRKKFADILKDRKYKALMYSEEAFISEIVRQHERKCFYDSEVEVIHNEHAVTSKIGISKKSKYLADSLRVVRDEFFVE